MSESTVLYEAMREIIRVTVQLEVGRATSPLQEEIRSLRTQLETRSAAPLVGVPGPAGKDGRDGVDGKDGRDGKDGERGEKGERGADGLAGRDGAPSIVPGPRGEPGERGAEGVQGPPGRDGLAGRDGAPSTVPGPQGERGERGADGIATREEIEAIWEERKADMNVRTFADVYQGVFEPDKLYTRGLLATWGGSLWLSLNETRSKPGENDDWKLVVKRGADGRK